MNRHLKTAALGAVLASGIVQGCAALMVGGAAATGAMVIHDRRTAGAVVDDKRIELTAYDIKYKSPQLGKDSSVSITSYNGKVLLTGTVPTAEVDRRFAEQVAGIAGVRNVIDETSIGAPRSVSDTAKDSYITSKVKISLFGVGGKPSDPTYIKVVTSGGVVYLMGLVTRAEGDAAADQVRYIEGVKRVVKLFEYR